MVLGTNTTLLPYSNLRSYSIDYNIEQWVIFVYLLFDTETLVTKIDLTKIYFFLLPPDFLTLTLEVCIPIKEQYEKI